MEKDFTPLLVVAVALSDGNGRWLMHQRPEDREHGGLWEFPGGKVEAGESPRAALVREIEEEASLQLDATALLEVGFAADELARADESRIVILLYTSSRWSGALKSNEGGIFKWMGQQEIVGLAMPPLDEALTRQLFEKSS